jgi:hypothetical protein
VLTLISPLLPTQFVTHVLQDFMKESVYYFNKLPDTGEPDFATGPQVLINNVGVIDITTDPRTGIIYMVDLIFKRSLRIYNAGAAALPVTVVPDPASVSYNCFRLYGFICLDFGQYSVVLHACDVMLEQVDTTCSIA